PIALGFDADAKNVGDLTRTELERKAGMKADEKGKANSPPAGNTAINGQPTDQLATLRQELDQLRSTRQELAARDTEIARVEEELGRRRKELADEPLPKLAASAPIPQPEISTAENGFSTFSLNVSDVSFQLAAASLEKGQMPDPATVRSEEFINAFDYRDP